MTEETQDRFYNAHIYWFEALVDSRTDQWYRLLCVNLEFMAIAHPFQVLVVAGASPKDGKSLTAANLAAAYARAGKQVILLDADLHQPDQQRLFKVSNNMGLTTALRSVAELVIVDSPPLTIVTDSMVLGIQADGMVLVARGGKTRRANIKQVRHLLNQVQAPPPRLYL